MQGENLYCRNSVEKRGEEVLEKRMFGDSNIFSIYVNGSNISNKQETIYPSILKN